MKFGKQKFGNSSRKPAPEGNYIGVLCGFCDLGWQTGQYGRKHQVMLRWELRDPGTGAPVLDDEEKPFVTAAAFAATVNANFDGEPSRLAHCLVAHGIEVPEDGEIESDEWRGRVAILEVGLDTTGMYSRVFEFNPIEEKHRVLGREGKLARSMPWEHWEESDESDPPGWARGLLKMGSLAGRVPGEPYVPERDEPPAQDRGRPAGRPQGRPNQPANPAPATSPYRKYEEPEDEDIPF